MDKRWVGLGQRLLTLNSKSMKGPRTGSLSTGTNTFHSILSLKWDFRTTRKYPEFREEELVVPGKGSEWKRSEGRQVLLWKWEWEEIVVVWEQRPSCSAQGDRKCGIQRTSWGNLIPVISLALPKSWTVTVCRCLPDKQNSNTLCFYFVFLKFKLYFRETGVSLSLQSSNNTNCRTNVLLSSHWFHEDPHSPPRLSNPWRTSQDPGCTGVRGHPSLVNLAASTNVQLFPVSCPALWDRSERLW